MSAPRQAPPFLLPAILLLWGQQTGLWIWAVPAALLVEAHRLIPPWNLSEKDFARVSHACTAAVVGIALYVTLTQPIGIAVMTAVSWYPVACLPLVLAQRVGGLDGVPARSLLPILSRSLSWSGRAFFRRTLDVTYPYLALTMFAAAAANAQGPLFYAGMLLVAGWALWTIRPKAGKAWLWAGCIAGAAAIGYMGQIGLHSLQSSVEAKFANLIPGSGALPASNVRNTAIGAIGDLKLSGRIALRLTPKGDPPVLLRSATFTSYAASQWISGDTKAVKTRPAGVNGNGEAWQIGPGGSASKRTSIALGVGGTPAWLPLPSGAARIAAPPDAPLRLDRYGSVQLDDGPSLLNYDVEYGPEPATEAEPESADTFVPPGLRPTFSNLAEELHLAGMTAMERRSMVTAFFERNFTYSLYQAAPTSASPSGDPLVRFLTETHSGHCEYFATATVLLLRAAGTPARYAIGYSVQEWSEREQAYVVRDRHAHAWARVFDGNRWQDLDTTPASWADIEGSRASRWQDLEDWLSWAWYRFRQWSLPGHLWLGNAARWLLAPTLFIGAWVLYRFSKRQSRPRKMPTAGFGQAGSDSEFYAIERYLEREGFSRRDSESLQEWLHRLTAESAGALDVEGLKPLVRLHYRCRFDPRGLAPDDRARLKSMSEAWLAAGRR